MQFDDTNLNDFGFSTISEEVFTAKTKEPETQVVEQAIQQAKKGQVKDIETKVEKIWDLLDYHYQDIDKHKEQLNKIYKIKMEEIEQLIVPLLNNLAKSSSNEYIYWPNRRTLLEQQIEKITSVTRDINIFTETA